MNPELAAALAHLDQALDSLESAAERRLDPEARRTDLELELQLMADDRARLATELESASARAARLESATSHLAPRIDSAILTLQGVLGFDVPAART